MAIAAMVDRLVTTPRSSSMRTWGARPWSSACAISRAARAAGSWPKAWRLRGRPTRSVGSGSSRAGYHFGRPEPVEAWAAAHPLSPEAGQLMLPQMPGQPDRRAPWLSRSLEGVQRRLSAPELLCAARYQYTSAAIPETTRTDNKRPGNPLAAPANPSSLVTSANEPNRHH